ncbi:XRE family transcriptional regulator [Umezawaea sp. NPDC059074]|uniref:XRE family transcriptional regulator n=1 Tax=Umezawaea sp. NPDC059074 TaxID=3346716 RepID=UPI0036740E1A
MSKDWDAVSAAITTRMAELDMKQTELKERSGLALQTVREIQLNLQPRDRSKRTLTAMSEALGWPSDHLWLVLEGKDPGDPDAGDPVLTELAVLKDAITVLVDRVDAIERRLAADAE